MSKARIDAAREWAHEFLLRTCINPEAARASIASRTPTFEQIFNIDDKPDFRPNAIQSAIAGLPVATSGSLTIAEAPTGEGKTEMAEQHFFSLFEAGVVDGVYIALPMRTAATQLFERVTKHLKRAFPDPDNRPPVTLAVPGYLSFDDVKGVKLSKFEVLWDDEDKARARYRGWASEQSKRYLLGSVVIGTIDQVLLSRLTVKHAHMRATALLRHLLIIDEVHASDVYMTRLVIEVLRWHLKAGGYALLMSATLGGAVRERLLYPEKQQVKCPALKECVLESFPLITHRRNDEALIQKLSPISTRNSDVLVDIHPLMFEPEHVASLAYQAAEEGAHVLVIRNTVAECLKAQFALEKIAGAAADHLFRCNGVIAPHHSRFAQSDRALLDSAVEAFFGKTRSPGGVALIATQTIQQSLDLDADLLITDLCPMDVLLQRIGRLFRHLRPGSERPEGFRRARVILLVPNERDLSRHINKRGEARGPCGIGTVYADLCALEATWRLIEKSHELHLPAQCRELVEYALHPEVLKAIANKFGDPWNKHREQIVGIEHGQNLVALMNLVNVAAHFDERDVLFPSDDVKVGTRLGEGDRLILFPEPFASPFDKTPIATLSLPAFQARGLPDKVEPTNIELREGAVTFCLDGRSFIYDRLGFRTLELREDENDVMP